MPSLMRLFRSEPRAARPLYQRAVERAREPHWYRDGAVPDTLDGRFAMLSSLLALVMVRLENGGEEARKASVSLTECFIDDMDGEMRQIGVGDPVMSKKVGSLVGALGGRVGAWRRATAGEESWDAVIGRSIYRSQEPQAPARDHVDARLRRFWAELEAAPDEALLQGVLP